VTLLVFVTNATTGVNAVLRSLKLRCGDELLTTSHDYNACHNVLLETARQAGARVVKSVLHHLAQSQDQRKTASALEPCAQLEFQSTG
jgi:isopenicillin-N epimerase